MSLGRFYLSLVFFGVSLTAYTASLVDESFNVGDGPVSSDVRALALQADGKILVGGKFTSFNKTPCDGIVRLNRDGSIDPSFALGTGIYTDVRALLIQSTGEILVGGFFNSIYGKTWPALVRLKSDGSLDSSFPCRSNFFGGVLALASQRDGKILVGGLNNVQRLRSNGELDPDFAAPDWTNTVVASFAVQKDGKILVSGPPRDFGSALGSKCLVRLNPNGSLNSTFLPRLAYQEATDGIRPEQVTSLALEPDEKILALGRFSVLEQSGYEDRGLIRLNADGSRDRSFRLEMSHYSTGASLLSRGDGRTLIVGGTMTLDGVSRSTVAQILPGGILDLAFAPDFVWDLGPPFSGGPALATAAVVQTGGKVVVAGLFTSVVGIKRMGLVRLNDQSQTNLNVLSLFVASPGPSFIEANTNAVVEITRAGDPNRRITVDYMTIPGTAEAGKDFISVKGRLAFEPGERTKVVLVPILDDSNRETNETFRIQLTNPSSDVRLGDHASEEITIIDDDGFHFDADHYLVGESSGEIELIVYPGQGGNYNFSVGYETKGETAILGRDFANQSGLLQFSAWWQDVGIRTFQVPIFDNPEVDGDRSFLITLRNPSSGLTLGPDSTVRVTIQDNDTFAGAAKGVNGTIHTSAVLPNGRVLIGGWFSAVDGLRRNYVARLQANGSVDKSFEPGVGPNAPVTALALQSDGRLIIGGPFTEVSGLPRLHIARLNENGSLDSSFDPGRGWDGPLLPLWDELPTIRSIAIQRDGKILSGGNFTNYAGVFRPGVARLNPDGSLDTSFDPKLKDTRSIRSLALQRDNKIIVGGDLGTASLARLKIDGSVDLGFAPPSFGKALSLLVLTNAQILVGTHSSSINEPGIYRLNPDGSRDMTYQGKAFFEETVLSLAELPDGKILAAGRFWDPNTDPGYLTGFIRLTSSGILDRSFVLGTRGRALILVRSINLEEGGRIFLGGTFGQYDAEVIALGRKAEPGIGIFINRRSPSAYHWLRLNSDGRPVNDLRFEKVFRLENGAVHLALAGQASPGFSLETSENLRDWSAIGTNMSPNEGLVFRDNSATNKNQRFYRVH